jgi:hypothetical protein
MAALTSSGSQLEENAFRVVAIRHGGLYREFFFALAKTLKERYGSEIHFYCARPEMVASLSKDAPEGIISSIQAIEFAHPTSFNDRIDEESVLARAHRYEKRYGRSMNWFAVLDRHFGRGFAPAGFHFPKSLQSETTNHLQVVETYCGCFDFWEQEFDSKGITLMINGDWREGAVARAHGVPLRCPTSARYQNYHYWTTDEFAGAAQFPEIFAAASEDGLDFDLADGPQVQFALRKTMQKYGSLASLTASVAGKIKSAAYYRYKNHSKSRLYYVSSELRFFLRRWQTARKMKRLATVKLENLTGKDFVFFPLQVDPEIGFQGRSPEFFFLHTAIVAMARDLPAGMLLAVKEHFPALGYRPEIFYEQIRELKNVVMLDITESGIEVVRRCRAVATVNGSAGQEAAMMGKPVISFGRHNLYNLLPHVHVITDLGRLSESLRQALGEDFDHDTAGREGKRFAEAIRELSFDLQKFSHFNKTGFDNTALETALEKLRDSLRWDEHHD